MTSSLDSCRWLHEQLEALPLFTFPFNPDKLPTNGVYFFYEKGELWGHGRDRPRVVRVGTHTGEGRLRRRIEEHFLLDESKMRWDAPREPAVVRSVFRKNIGRMLLASRGDFEFMEIWNLSHIDKALRLRSGGLELVRKDKALQQEVTQILRDRFSFRCISVEGSARRKEIEARCIGTLARCTVCRPSARWLGRGSPVVAIREGGLWLVQGRDSDPLDDAFGKLILDAIKKTLLEAPVRQRRERRTIATLKGWGRGHSRRKVLGQG